MTKFILHGGGMTTAPEDKQRKFFSELAKNTSSNLYILFVFFAKPQNDWKKMEKIYKKLFIEFLPAKKITFELAIPDQKKFAKQINNADIIYFRGGMTKLLIDQIKDIPKLRSLFNKKVIIGSSAGANMLAKYYYSNSDCVVKKGLGIIPIKVFCHYDKSKAKKLNDLKEYKEKIKVYSIKEGEYAGIDQ